MAQLGSGSGTGYGTGVIDTKQTYENGVNAGPDSTQRIDAEFANDALAAIVALQTILGAAPQGIYASVQARLGTLDPGGSAPTGVSFNTQSGTAYTVVAADHGKALLFTSSSAVTVTLPQTSTEELMEGFQCMLIQRGAGQVSVALQGTDALESRGGETKLSGQHSAATLLKLAAGSPNTWGLYGDTTA